MSEPDLNFIEEESDNESLNISENDIEDNEDDNSVKDNNSVVDEELNSDDEININEEDEEDEENEEDEEDEENEENDVDEDYDVTSEMNESKFSQSNSDEEYNDSDEEYNDSDYELYLFDENIEENIIEDTHHLLKVNNITEIKALSTITKNNNNIIIDEYHKSLPILTKYERAKLLGIRANQINNGCAVFVQTNESDIDGYLIAERELLEKKLPFIIKRPLPSGKNEFWNVKDLELV